MEKLTGGSFKVLVVDNSEQSCMSTCQALEPMSAATEFVASGVLALELLKRNKYDLVLMAVALPEMNGISVTRALRDFETASNRDFCQRIVGLSDDCPEDVKLTAIEAGMDDFLHKPLDVSVHSNRLLGESNQCCNSCGFLAKLKKENKLRSVQDVGLSRAYWLSPCALQTMLSGCEQLRSLDIAHNVDVNQLVGCLSAYCPQLESFSFTYLQNAFPGEKRQRLQSRYILLNIITFFSYFVKLL
jgi:CheY-like chemotaxis protein